MEVYGFVAGAVVKDVEESVVGDVVPGRGLGRAVVGGVVGEAVVGTAVVGKAEVCEAVVGENMILENSKIGKVLWRRKVWAKVELWEELLWVDLWVELWVQLLL